MKLNSESKILVVCGGVSTEREVSLRSGKSVFEALRRKGYKGAELFDLRGDNIADLLAKKPAIAFLALHGKGGEDGCIQGALEFAGIPYTGPGVAASAVCMDKILTKRILSTAGIPTARFEVLHREDVYRGADGAIAPDAIDALESSLGYPMVLKSPCQGSSIGVVIVHCRDAMAQAVDEVFRYGDEMLAEQFVDGPELTLPILGNDEPVALPIIEITSEREFYDYTSKYTSGLCHHIIPARIDDATAKAVGEIGLRAYRVLGCKVLSRIDFIVDKARGPMVIEVNTLPGMTDMSLFPDSARYAGIPYDDLVEKMLLLGASAKRELF